jgi:hypothetical protein
MGYRPPLVPTIALLVLGGLTTPLLALALPFAIGVALWRRRGYDVAVAVALLLPAIVQASNRVTSPEGTSSLHLDLGQVWRLDTVRVGAGAALGDRLLHPYYEHLGITTAAIGGLAIFLVVLVIAVFQRGADRLACAFLVVTSVVVVPLAMVLRPTWFDFPDIGYVPGGVLLAGRYAGVPALCLVMVAVIGADRFLARHERSALTWVFGALAGAYLLMLVVNVPVELWRPSHSDFQNNLSDAQQLCAEHGGQGIVDIRTGPFPAAPGGFRFVVTCHEAFG